MIENRLQWVFFLFIYTVRFTFLTFNVTPPASEVLCLSQTSERPDASWQFRPHICLVGLLSSGQISFSASGLRAYLRLSTRAKTQRESSDRGNFCRLPANHFWNTLFSAEYGVTAATLSSTQLLCNKQLRFSLYRIHPFTLKMFQNYKLVMVGKLLFDWWATLVSKERDGAATDVWSVLVT